MTAQPPSDITETAKGSPERINVLGVGISVLNIRSACDLIIDALASERRAFITVTGVHGVMESQRNGEIKRIHNRSFLTTPDGMPLVWIGKARGFDCMNRVYGPDLMLEVMRRTEDTSYGHFFYGGKAGVAEDIAAEMVRQFPRIRIAGSYTPPFRKLAFEEAWELAQRVEASGADIFWVGLSTPKQELFMAEYSEKLDCRLMIGVGAAFDFLTGRVPQAPRWIQRSGFEWLFRLCQDPRRLWKRYLRNNPEFLILLACQMSGLKKFPILK